MRVCSPLYFPVISERQENNNPLLSLYLSENIFFTLGAVCNNTDMHSDFLLDGENVVFTILGKVLEILNSANIGLPAGKGDINRLGNFKLGVYGKILILWPQRQTIPFFWDVRWLRRILRYPRPGGEVHRPDLRTSR